MLAGVIEKIDPVLDVKNFIVSNQRMVLPTMTVNDLCRSKSMPLPPSAKPLSMNDIINRRFLNDTIGTVRCIYGWLATRIGSYDEHSNTSPRSITYSNDISEPLASSKVVAKALEAAFELNLEDNGLLMQSTKNLKVDKPEIEDSPIDLSVSENRDLKSIFPHITVQSNDEDDDSSPRNDIDVPSNHSCRYDSKQEVLSS